MWTSKVCRRCCGRGMIPCPECYGAGVVSGYGTCPVCEGDRDIDCPDCDGSGEIVFDDEY